MGDPKNKGAPEHEQQPDLPGELDGDVAAVFERKRERDLARTAVLAHIDNTTRTIGNATAQVAEAERWLKELQRLGCERAAVAGQFKVLPRLWRQLKDAQAVLAELEELLEVIS